MDSYDYMRLGKSMTFHNVMILIKVVFNKDNDNDYYNILLEKCSYQLPKIIITINKSLYKL